MHILSQFKLRVKLTLLLGFSALAVVLSIGAAAWLMQDRMFNDRIDKLRAVVQSTISIAQSLESRVAAHQSHPEQALALLRDDVHAWRFDNGAGYVFAQRAYDILVLHGSVPALEGKPAPPPPKNTKPLTELIHDVLRNSAEGTISYRLPSRGRQQSQPKVTYVARFAPWNLDFGAGAYVDDITAAFHAPIVS